VLRAAIGACGGVVVEARADDSFAVFTSPVDAVAASIRIHRDLATQRWVGSRDVRVRIGLHSGYPTRRHGNYVGMAVHTAARVSACAHGGQTVVSGDTKEACTGLTVPGARFRRLGTHRLRGIPDAVELLQIMAEGLERSFPPLRL
jgi:class 3 adenylate cyclase